MAPPWSEIGLYLEQGQAPSLREARAEGWGVLSPRYEGELLSSVMLLFIAGQCALFCTNFSHRIIGTRRFSPSSCGRIISAVPEFAIQDLSPLAYRHLA